MYSTHEKTQQNYHWEEKERTANKMKQNFFLLRSAHSRNTPNARGFLSDYAQ